MNLRVITLCAAAFALIGAAQRAFGQAAEAPVPGSNLKVSVLTFGPGDDPWEKFGHNAIRIQIDDPFAPSEFRDVAYNWGYFDFEQKNFYVNFIQGRLLYAMIGEPGEKTMLGYKERLNRSVWEQELNLAPAQRLTLWKKLVRMDTDANRYYRYDYYTYNCSTRVRDEIDDITVGRLGALTKGVPSGTTFRFHTRRLIAESPWLYVALQGVLGHGAPGHEMDRPISQWDEMFLPTKLHDRLNEVKVMIDGREVPLVKSDNAWFTSNRPLSPQRPPATVPWFLGAGLVLSAAFIGLGRIARRHWAARIGLILLSVPWTALMGVGGAIILWAWFFTDHLVAARNENVLHVSALALPLLVLMPMLAMGRRRGARVTKWLAVSIAAISLLGAVLKLLPGFYQVNWDIIALCLPVNVAMAWVAWKLSGVILAAPVAPAGVETVEEKQPGKTRPGGKRTRA
ncbi:MAG: hypothetical protein JWO87_2095 [Phycisphaerales bacterium]|nr:hypothetical protein [Phycisphaerales bacterium]